MPSCFVSYASSDRVMVESLAEDLRSHRYQVWIDFEGILGGAQWEAAIRAAIDRSEVCIVALTPDALQSQWVKREIDLARQTKKHVIPVLMREIPLPEGLEALGIADLQYVNFVRYGYAAGMKQLRQALPEVNVATAVRTGVRALVIEDIPAQQVAIRQVLGGMGIEAVVAGDFERALELVRGDPYDVITLDMQLDDMDPGGQQGILLLDQMRTHQKDVPVIIISGLELTGSQVRDFLVEYQADDYLKKPFNPGELRPIVEKALKSR